MKPGQYFVLKRIFDLQAQEPWSRCCQWHIPCFLKPPAATASAPNPTTPAQDSAQNSPRAHQNRLRQSRAVSNSPSNNFIAKALAASPRAASGNGGAVSEGPRRNEGLLQQDSSADGAAVQLATAQVVHLDVSTCAVLPDLALQGDAATWQADRGSWQVDFGK